MIVAVAVKELGAVPEIGDNESHGAVLDTLQLKVPDPELLIVTVFPAGLLPPWVAEKARFVGARVIVGVGADVIVTETATDCGELEAPAAEMEMLPL